MAMATNRGGSYDGSSSAFDLPVDSEHKVSLGSLT